MNHSNLSDANLSITNARRCASVASAPTSDDSTGATGNTPLSNFGLIAYSRLLDASNKLADRLPNTVVLNTRISKRDEVEKLHLGFDTLEWTAEISEQELETLLVNCEYWFSASPIDLDGVEVVVRRLGGGIHCWRISTSLGLAIHVPCKPEYRLRVLADSKYCLSTHIDDLEERAAILAYKVCELDSIPDVRLSRVDVALDVLMPQVKFENIIARVAKRDVSVIKKARSAHPRLEGSAYRSLQIGKSDVVLRIYDKKAEAVKTGDWAAWQAVYGGIEIPDGYTVGRFEYQQRGGFLRSMKDNASYDTKAGEDVEQPLFPSGINTLAEYQASAPAILLYLTQAWFRFAGKKKGAENTRTTLGWWQAISNHFVAGDWYSFLPDVWRSVKRVASRNLERLEAMTAGCLSAVAAVLSFRRDDIKVGVREALDHIFQYVMADGGDADKYEKWIDGRDKRITSIRFGTVLK